MEQLSKKRKQDIAVYFHDATVQNFNKRHKDIVINKKVYSCDWREKEKCISVMKDVRISASGSIIDNDNQQSIKRQISEEVIRSKLSAKEIKSQSQFYCKVYDNKYQELRLDKFRKEINQNAFEFYRIQLLDILCSGLWESQSILLSSYAKIIYAIAGRGFGKTDALNRKAPITCLLEPNTVVIVTNLKDEQVQTQNYQGVIKAIKNAIGDRGYNAVVKQAHGSQNLLWIEFYNGSIIHFVSGKAGGGEGNQYRGKTVKLLIWDECSFVGGDFNQVLTAAVPSQRNIRYGDLPQIICCSSMNIKQEGITSKHLMTRQWNARAKEQYKILNNFLNTCKIDTEMKNTIIDEYKRFGLSQTFLGLDDEDGQPLYKKMGAGEVTMLIGQIEMPLFSYWFGALNYCKIEASSKENPVANDAITEAHHIHGMPEAGRKVELENDSSSLESRNLWNEMEIQDIRLTINSDFSTVLKKMAEADFQIIMSVDPNSLSKIDSKTTGNSDLGAVLIAIDHENKFIFILKDYTVYSKINKNIKNDLRILIDNMTNDGLFNQVLLKSDSDIQRTILTNLIFESNAPSAVVALQDCITGPDLDIHVKKILQGTHKNKHKDFIQYTRSSGKNNQKNNTEKGVHKLQSKVNRLSLLQKTYAERRIFHCNFLRYNDEINKKYSLQILENQMVEFVTDAVSFNAKIKRSEMPVTFDALDAVSQTLVTYFKNLPVDQNRSKTSMYENFFGNIDNSTGEINIEASDNFYKAKIQYQKQFNDIDSEYVIDDDNEEDDYDTI